MKYVRMIFVFFLILNFLGCGTGLQFVKHSQNTYPVHCSASKIQIFYSEPDLEYESIGMINWDHYQCGFRAPSITDVLPQLKWEASQKGGDALIIRKQEVARTERNLRIIAEVIKFKDQQ